MSSKSKKPTPPNKKESGKKEEGGEKVPRKRSPPMDRAMKFARLADKNCGRLRRLVGNWRAECTSDQKVLNATVVEACKAAAPQLEKALVSIGLLKDTGLEPVEARGRAITEPLAAGERVRLKDATYNEELHGPTNDFEVVAQIGMQVRIRPVGDMRGPQPVVSRMHLSLVDDAGEDGEIEDSDEGESIDDQDA